MLRNEHASLLSGYRLQQRILFVGENIGLGKAC